MQEHRFRTPRNARYFTLGEPGPGISDLWIALHGYGQLARDFLSGFEPIVSPDRLIVAPEALSRFYTGSPDARAPGARVGAAWMTREDRLAEIDDQMAYLDGLATELLRQLPQDVRVRTLGFSQGASAACRWATLGGVRLDELVLWAGEIPADLPERDLGERLARLRVHLVAGHRDRLVPEAVVAHQQERLRKAGIDPHVHRFEGGHRLDAAVLQTIAASP